MAKKRKTPRMRSDCTIPPAIPESALPGLAIPSPDHEERAIREYVELEANDETVVHLEKVKTERIFDTEYDVWDVRTDKNRWWVITSPTNLYSQQLFPSLDYTLSFHIGVTMRMRASDRSLRRPEHSNRLLEVLQKLGAASDALDEADEAEDFQGVGVRLRECLVDLARAFQKSVPTPKECPKGSDFIQWSEVAAGYFAAGERNDEVRALLKTTSKATWQLVNSLTHSKNAYRMDGAIAVLATEYVVNIWLIAIARLERGVPERCPKCASYRLVSDYRPDLQPDSPYIVLCERCGWEKPIGIDAVGR